MNWRLFHPSTVVSRWPFQNAVGIITPDMYGRYPGTLVNAPTWSSTGPKNLLQCIETDGDTQHVNFGDVLELNAVSAFTLCFWMNQDVIDQNDYMFTKLADGDNLIRIYTSAGGTMLCVVSNGAPTSYGTFDYSTVISAANWHHVAMVFDGTQAGNASRLITYVDGAPVTLAFTGTIPATTADLSGRDFLMGYTTFNFDGRRWDLRLASVPYTRDEVNRIIHQPAPVF